MRRRNARTAIPPVLAVFDAADWDSRELAEGEAFAWPPDEEGWQRLFRSRWLAARADWAYVNAPGLWPDLLAELLSFPV